MSSTGNDDQRWQQFRPSEGRTFADHLHESRSGLERTTSTAFGEIGFEMVVPDSRRIPGWPASLRPSLSTAAVRSRDRPTTGRRHRLPSFTSSRPVVPEGDALRLAEPIGNDGRSNGCLPPSGLVRINALQAFPGVGFHRRFGAGFEPATPRVESGALPVELANIDNTHAEPICGTPHSDPFRVSSAPLDWCGQWSRGGHANR